MTVREQIAKQFKKLAARLTHTKRRVTMALLPVYLRKEPTTDALTLANYPDFYNKPYAYDVVAYSDPDCTKRKAHWTWDMKSKPTRRNKYVTLNCYRWKAVWLPDLQD